jgi:nitroreductase
MSSETMQVLLNRVSVRKYRDEPVSDEVLDAVLHAAFRAPTSSNIQAYSVIVVRDQAAKEKIAVAANNQQHIIDCPLWLGFCADLTRIEHAMRMHGHELGTNNLETGLVSSIDATLVGMSTYHIADSLGLKGVMIGAVRNKPAEIAAILGLPARVYCVFGMCLGYVDEVPVQKPRMDFDAMVHREQYDTGKMKDMVGRYDDALAEHYRGAGRTTNDNSWSNEVDEKFNPQPRADLRTTLAGMGFDFA